VERRTRAGLLEFLRYLDQFGKTKAHALGCPFFGRPRRARACCARPRAASTRSSAACAPPSRSTGPGGRLEVNPFGARAVRLYLREVHDSQAKVRGIAYKKKRCKRPSTSSHSPP
jgi:hypothetical protein